MRWKPLVTVAVLVAGVATARFTVFDAVRVSSGSMAPTVCTGDIVIVDHLGPRRGLEIDDIITFASPIDGIEQIKRVVAVGEQRVGLADGVLMVDGRKVVEAYVDTATIDGVYFGPVMVPEGSVFVMGDDRELSIDSRAFGPIPIEVVDGRLVTALWSTCTA
jgi:signal peptidase I